MRGLDGSTPSGEAVEIAGPETSSQAEVSAAPERAPLTGLMLDGGADAGRAVLAVKIDAVEAARPQAGLNEADIVVEELVEGGLSRLLALYHSRDPSRVGPVRSARGVDVSLLMSMARPLFASSGANPDYRRALAVSGVIDVGPEVVPEAYRRAEDRSQPHDLFADPAVLRRATPELVVGPTPPFAWRSEAEEVPGVRSDGVDVDWGTTRVGFRWDAVVGGWRRTQDGTAHVDEAGAVVAPTNVVVQFVTYRDSGLRDVNGASVPVADLDGIRGAAWLFTGGSVVEGEWYKANATQPARFSDASGVAVGLTPGTTWVLLAPTGSATLVESS